MKTIIFSLFILSLLVCLFLGYSILIALSVGYILFFSYGLWEKHSVKGMLLMSFSGVRKVRKILLVLCLIGMISAVWRAAGTIPWIVYSSSHVIVPAIFLLITFLLNCLVSFLTGTALGTAATIGIICMSIGRIMGVDEAFLGGAIVSGIYFGDRCSPMSTSALLISELTKTDIFRNMKLMVKTSYISFVATCMVYIMLGLTSKTQTFSLSVLELFASSFNLQWIVILPAVLIIVLALFKVRVVWIMLTSIVTACFMSVWVQGIQVYDLLSIMIFGYRANHVELAPLLNGGGIISMVKVVAIVCISSSYSGIFNGTTLLSGLKKSIAASSKWLTPFGSTLMTSTFSALIACNQTLTIMLAYDLCKDMIPDEQEMAITLEDTAVLVSALIPWSIAAAVPIVTIGAPVTCLLFACYLYFIPCWRLLLSQISAFEARRSLL